MEKAMDIPGGLRALIPNLVIVEDEPESEPTSPGLRRLTVFERVHLDGLLRGPKDNPERVAVQATRPEGCWCLGTGGDPTFLGVTYSWKDGASVQNPPAWSHACESCDQGRSDLAAAIAKRDEAIRIKREDRIDAIWGDSEWPKRYGNARLDAEPQNDLQGAVMDQLREWAKDVNPVSLWLWGPVGTGKTWDACAAGDAWVEIHARSVLFTTVGGLLLKIRGTFNRPKGESGETEASILESVRDVDLLILDDVGRGGHTDWAHETLWELINARYLDEKPMIITSNKKPSEIAADLGEATLSRILEECTVIHVGGDDLRTSKVRAS